MEYVLYPVCLVVHLGAVQYRGVGDVLNIMWKFKRVE